MHLRAFLPLLAAAAIPACSPSTQPAGGVAVSAAAAERPDDPQPIARTAHFELYSRIAFNLHDRLKQWAVEDARSGAACIASLPKADKEGWDKAVDAFHAFRPDVIPPKLDLRIRYELLQPNDPSFDEGLGKVPAWYRPALASASPAYRRCWWSDDDRRNREWILSNAARLARAEAVLAKRIETAHQVAFPTERIPIDVVPTVDYAGANTVVHPHHIVISSTGPGYDGFGGLELLFHEGSHTVVSPRSDGSIAAIRRAAEAQHVELPRDLWHVVLFYTAGDATKRTVREIWAEHYVQYLYTSGLFERAWPTLREPLEHAWQPYLDGKSTLDEAARRLVVEIGKKTP